MVLSKKLILECFFTANLAFYLFSFGTLSAQNSRSIGANNQLQARAISAPSYGTQKTAKATQNKKKLSNKQSITNYYDSKIEEYHLRMAANRKKYKKMIRKMEKPKYSDPAYFGHKRKPKKRIGKKRKFCEECSIVH